ncbi:unnamed protein product [Ceratitis capitata]|uniref:(Mediterranean fruit fly) hypothetical protein n=1 Tax=Ceratitis capitata TaxID=7213 RepID=A0A811URJ1_CERCA|nr:unnamed protein product [Ceratitis capitata]
MQYTAANKKITKRNGLKQFLDTSKAYYGPEFGSHSPNTFHSWNALLIIKIKKLEIVNNSKNKKPKAQNATRNMSEQNRKLYQNKYSIGRQFVTSTFFLFTIRMCA